MADEVTLPDEVTPVVVAGVMTSGNTGALGRRVKSPLAKLIEQAMADAVTQALADGVSMDDTEALQERMQAARREAKDWFAESMRKTAEEAANR